MIFNIIDILTIINITFFILFLQNDVYSDNYYDRYLLDSPYNLCRDPLMRKGEVSAPSSAQQRGPDQVHFA